MDAPGYTLPMSAISSDEVARVAALARVALSEEEVTRLAGELDAVAVVLRPGHQRCDARPVPPPRTPCP